MLKLTTDEYINKCKLIHKDLYIYDDTIYINSRSKVSMICKAHGMFTINAQSHLRGNGCKLCTYNNYTKLSYINKANIIYSNRYEYIIDEPIITHNTKIKFICKLHGIKVTNARTHLNKKGCLTCYNSMTTDEFISKSNIIHNYSYDYSKCVYTDSKSKVTITCPIHGDFQQIANSHLNNKGCGVCANNITSNTELFIKKAKEKGYLYDYSKCVYVSRKEPVIITCLIHGDFQQRPGNHLNGQGCNMCKISKGEQTILNWIKNNNILYYTQYRFNDCIYRKELRFDFYLPIYNLCIEYDGKQHYEAIDYFGGDRSLISINRNDNIKNKYCIDNNINLLRIPYWEFNNIDKILLNKIKELNE